MHHCVTLAQDERSVLRSCLRAVVVLQSPCGSKLPRLRLLRSTTHDVAVALNARLGAMHRTALIEAVADGQAATVSALVRCPGVDVHARDLAGRTAFDVARHSGDAAMMARVSTPFLSRMRRWISLGKR